MSVARHVPHPLDVGKIIGDIKSTSRKNALTPNRSNLLPCTVETSRQGSGKQKVGCLLFSLVRIFADDGS